MRVIVLAVLLYVVFACANAQQIWKFCSGDRSKDLLTVTNVILDPAVPKTGAPLSITLQGDLKEDIQGAAFVDVDVSYSGVQLFQGQVPACSQDFLPCPIKAGKIDQKFTQTVPGFAPPGGPYTGTARLADGNGNNFTCITFDFMMDSSVSAAEAREPASNDDMIKIINSYNKVAWKSGRNPAFEGLTVGDVSKKLLGARLAPVSIDSQRQAVFAEAAASLPQTFDWRTEKLGKCVHPIRNQEQCGSCWAFAGSEALSDRFCIQSNGAVDVVLSPQYLVSCDTTNMGCNGGYLNKAWNWMHTHGIPTDKCMPYTSGGGSSGSCPRKCHDGTEPKFYKAKNVKVITGGEQEMQQEIYKGGPIEVGFTVYRDFLQYTSGVYHHVTGGLLGGHAVKIVGWGVSSTSNTPYWIVANSWGTSWGLQGFFWIKRGTNECGIESNAVSGDADL